MFPLSMQPNIKAEAVHYWAEEMPFSNLEFNTLNRPEEFWE